MSTPKIKSLHLPKSLEELPLDWEWSRLDDLCVGVLDCPHSTPKLVTDGPFVVRTQDILTGIFRMEEAGRVSEDTYRERIVRGEPHHGDLVYSREGTYFGIAAEVPANTRVCLGQRMMLIKPKPEQIHFRYLRYWLNSPMMAAHIHGFRDGTVAERLNLPTVRGLPVAIPPLPEQRAIAHILGALDDKIELNRQMNATLENVARALFQSWFVDFDPVRAKAAGRQPAGMDAATAALFPKSFAESALGAVPIGWGVASFSKTIELMGGGTPKTSVAEYWNGDIPWFSVVDAPNDSDIYVIDTEKKITKQGLEESSTRLLPVGTTIMSARGTVGKCALIGVPMAMNQSCYGVRGQNERGDYFTYFALRNAVSDLQRSTHGSVFDTITRDTFSAIQVPVIPVKLTLAFDRQVNSFLKQILLNLHQSRTLAALRDTLLPRLLSGELRIHDAEQHITEAL